MPQPDRGGQRVYGSLIRFSRPQGLALHVIPQHQLPVMWVQVQLLVHPVRPRVVSVANPSYETGLERQNQLANDLTLTTRIRISEVLSTEIPSRSIRAAEPR